MAVIRKTVRLEGLGEYSELAGNLFYFLLDLHITLFEQHIWLGISEHGLVVEEFGLQLRLEVG
jgi:hypothetical protein